MSEFLAIPREAYLPALVQWISQIVDLCNVDIVKSKPLHIKESAEAIERISAAGGSTSKATHSGVALEGTTLVHGKHKDHSGARPEGIVELLLVLPLRCPDTMLHRFHYMLSDVAGDDEVPCLRVLQQCASLEASWFQHSPFKLQGSWRTLQNT
eukprot:CAMPEP_0172812280 /NCGR_PEP_ID=MMETSP1075-20121228/9944_1 /TAXON_ID=2916 /ORGANISM="Ceratium fusus, Strain PA161109" /LENGTH=153 /DNA_ID=CAMNT_0013651815 /DNA_START=1224 /DNA_END=1681 /DNA_ORIENTATION=-